MESAETSAWAIVDICDRSELGGDELPADQHGEDDAEFEDQIGRGELEGHRRDEIGAFAEDRAGERYSRERTRRRRGPGRDHDRSQRGIGQEPAHLALGHDRLNNARQGKAEDQRPENLQPIASKLVMVRGRLFLLAQEQHPFIRSKMTIPSSRPARLGEVDKAVLDHRRLRVQTHDLVACWLVARDAMAAIGDQLLDRARPRALRKALAADYARPQPAHFHDEAEVVYSSAELVCRSGPVH
jgi:hypothetical protein